MRGLVSLDTKRASEGIYTLRPTGGRRMQPLQSFGNRRVLKTHAPAAHPPWAHTAKGTSALLKISYLAYNNIRVEKLCNEIHHRCIRPSLFFTVMN